MEKMKALRGRSRGASVFGNQLTGPQAQGRRTPIQQGYNTTSVGPAHAQFEQPPTALESLLTAKNAYTGAKEVNRIGSDLYHAGEPGKPFGPGGAYGPQPGTPQMERYLRTGETAPQNWGDFMANADAPGWMGNQSAGSFKPIGRVADSKLFNSNNPYSRGHTMQGTGGPLPQQGGMPIDAGNAAGLAKLQPGGGFVQAGGTTPGSFGGFAKGMGGLKPVPIGGSEYGLGAGRGVSGSTGLTGATQAAQSEALASSAEALYGPTSQAQMLQTGAGQPITGLGGGASAAKVPTGAGTGAMAGIGGGLSAAMGAYDISQNGANFGNVATTVGGTALAASAIAGTTAGAAALGSAAPFLAAMGPAGWVGLGAGFLYNMFG